MKFAPFFRKKTRENAETTPFQQTHSISPDVSGEAALPAGIVSARPYHPSQPPRFGEWVKVSDWVEEEDRPTSANSAAAARNVRKKPSRALLAIVGLVLVFAVGIWALQRGLPKSTVAPRNTIPASKIVIQKPQNAAAKPLGEKIGKSVNKTEVKP